MTIARRLVAFLVVMGFLVSPVWASEESSPHATKDTAAHEGAAHESSADHGGHKALRHDANDIYKEGSREPDAGKLFNNLKDHATEDTYELHIVSAHVALPIM